MDITSISITVSNCIVVQSSLRENLYVCNAHLLPEIKINLADSYYLIIWDAQQQANEI